MNRSQFALAIPLILGAWTAAAAPDAETLTYFGSRSRLCMVSSGYDGDLRLTGFGTVSSASDDVVLVLNPDGTGSITIAGLMIVQSATGPGATPSSLNVTDSPCDITYTLTPDDGLLTITLAPCVSTTRIGVAAGQQTEVTNVVNEFRLIDRQTKAVAVQSAPNVETLRNLSTGAVSQRVCHRGGTLFLTSGKPQVTGTE